MKKFFSTLFILVILSSCVFQQADSSSQEKYTDFSSSNQTLSTPLLPSDISSAQMTIDESIPFPNRMNTQDMLADIDYLEETLQKNYPYKSVLAQKGIKFEEAFQSYRNKISSGEIVDDFSYYNLLSNLSADFQGTAHFGVLSPESYSSAHELYKEYSEEPKEQFLFSVLNKPDVIKTYQDLDLYLNSTSPSKNIGEEDLVDINENIQTKIIEPNKIAYLNIESFYGLFSERDYDTLISFYRSISDYNHLIIDLTNNQGGSDGYWLDNIVIPNIDRVYSADNYVLYPDSTILEEYIKTQYDLSKSKPVDELPFLSNIDPNTLSETDRFFVNSMTVEPLDEKSKEYNGKIWMLVNRNVYSSGEQFAFFAKNSGFATLVGENTGGGLGGMDPFLLELPNSHYIMRFGIMNTFNPDGTDNELYGTSPNIYSTERQNPLQTCLLEIEKQVY